GVWVGLRSADEVRSAWQQLASNVAQAYPGLAWQALVEAQAPPGGVELVVGARRDPQWGPVIMVGFGGIGVELWNDVVLLPADASAAAVEAALLRLRGAAWLQGMRGRPPVDIQAVVRVVQQLGWLLRTEPRVVDMEINPLMAYPAGQGVLALDALMVIKPEDGGASE
ncbi:MAG: acetate--CoA ligase family protein, partial [Alicyclobacillus sp.]|nr:acetate--CoA ligase family protein [Alicyclobacillus sp.]